MKGPTPICPECGSAGVDTVEDELVCKRCKHTGTLGEFTKDSCFTHQIVAPSPKRRLPHLSDEEGDVDEHGET